MDLIRFLIVCIFAQNAYAFLPRFPEKLASNLTFTHEYEGKIVGGVPAAKNEFPFQVSLHRLSSSSGKMSHYCGGTLISANRVVTAAHCVNSKSASTVYVYYGNILLDKNLNQNSPFVCSVKEIVVHSAYNSATIENDIAMLKLSKNVVFSPAVAAIKLPAEKSELPHGTLVMVTGWGTTSEGGSLPDHLRAVAVPTMSTEDCRAFYPDEHIPETMLCAGAKEGGKDSCQGDSGGPLFVENEFRGVVSWGYGCARPDAPGVYTKVSHYTTFIKENS